MAEPLDFTGKTILVVGGSSGIGNGIAHGFLSRGGHVHVTGTRAAQEYSAEERWLSAQRKRDLRREWRKDLEEALDLPDALLTTKDDAFIDGVIELKKATDPRVASLGTYASEEGLGMFAKMEKLHDFLLG